MSTLLHLLLLTLLSFLAPTRATEPQKPYIILTDHTRKPSIFPTNSLWYSSLTSTPLPILHTFSHILHGFSTLTTPETISKLNSHPSVLAVLEDRRRELHTTRSPQFLGLRTQLGLWSDSDYGDDVIVGVLDTGVWPERRSFSDHNLGPVPERWRGACDVAPGFSGSLCNRKLIGARFFSKGRDAAFTGGVLGSNFSVTSPRDFDGHGTHTTSTAAGRHAFKASMEGYAAGIAKGVAPKARVAVYKVCWKGNGCMDSDILAAFDKAVEDGVDVLSVSIGGGDGMTSPYYLDPIAIGAYGAVARGVFVASSAGNDGPTAMSVTNLAPWLTTVGATTIDRTFPADVVLGDGRRFSGVSLYSGKPLGSKIGVVYPGKTAGMSAALCMDNSLDPKLVMGKIVICDRGSSPRVAKGLVVKQAGGVAMILANSASNGEGLVADAHIIPACAVGSNEGDLLKIYAATAVNPTATIEFKGTVVGVKPAPVVASFSGRGPNGLTPEILKPDIVAPGVNILAAWSDAVGPTGLEADTQKVEFNILSGTSMACPHVSGAAALLKSAHRDWTAAMIRSAMMTTASMVDNTNNILSDETTTKAATPFDFGAGHLNLNKAMDPGLVYDINSGDYIAFMCAIGYDARTIQVITQVPVACPAKKPMAGNLNYPSITVTFDGTVVKGQKKTVLRTVTNVGMRAEVVYRARVEMVAGDGVTVSVKPQKLVFSNAVKKRSFAVDVTVESPATAKGAARYGYLVWSDGTHEVRSPIVLSWTMPM